jgi:hypothetical protein
MPKPDTRSWTSLVGSGDLDFVAPGRPDPPVRGRGAVTEHCAGSAREDGSEPLTLVGEDHVPDRVDAAVNLMQPPIPKP